MEVCYLSEFTQSTWSDRRWCEFYGLHELCDPLLQTELWDFEHSDYYREYCREYKAVIEDYNEQCKFCGYSRGEAEREDDFWEQFHDQKLLKEVEAMSQGKEGKVLYLPG